MLKKLLLILLLLTLSNLKAFAISAESAILIDGETGRVLFEKNAHNIQGMASTTKIMTAILALEQTTPEKQVKVSHKAATTEGSSMYLNSGEIIKMESLVYGLMLNSGNDAATAIAESISGSTDEFAKLMNKKAKEICLKNTSFANPHGLDHQNHYSTAYDMAMLTKYALNNDKFREIVSTKKKNVEMNGVENSRFLTNHNKLLSLYENCIGVKTGFTKACGRCLVSASQKDGVTLIAVTLNAPDDWNDHISMYEKAFTEYKSYKIFEKNAYIASVDVTDSEARKLELYAKNKLTVSLMPEEFERIKIKYNYPKTVSAPIYRGQKLGTASILLDSKKIAETDLITGYGIEKQIKTKYSNTLSYLLTNMLSLFVKAV